jgi:uncharacterized protein with beta-barrel porin domain
MTFKMRLLLGAAAPLVFTLPAIAQVSISTATTAPVRTSTASSGAASDISITSAGSVTLTTPAAGTAAVTIDSNNSVTNAGSISIPNTNDVVGVRIQPGVTGNFTNTGTISLLEDYTRTDTDNDGDLDGPLAQGTNRVGVLLESGGAMNGNIGINGVVSVEGNNSAGVSTRSILNGNYKQNSSVSAIGSNSIGVDLRQNVTGNVEISTVATQGEGAVGVRVLGDVGGEFMIDGSVSSTGFTALDVVNYIDPFIPRTDGKTSANLRDADDLLVGGSAVEIRGSLAHGFLVNGNAIGGVDPTDDIKDVVQDFNENRTAGTISSFGSAPAVSIRALDGAAGRNINLARVRETVLDTLDDDKDGNVTEVIGTFNYDYGFMNRGAVTANGLNNGFAATGIDISGSADGAHTTTIEGGVFNSGTISGTSFEANATGVHIGAGASTPQIVNTGTIAAITSTVTTHDSTAILIEAGANVGSIVNNGLISAQTYGFDGDAVAVRDLSGTVTSFTNTSRISAGYLDKNTTDTITSGLGKTFAVDLSNNTTGVNFTQNEAADNARVFGSIAFGSGNDQMNLLSGEIGGDINFGAGSDTLTITSAKLTGGATFGGTGATVNLNAAEMTGALSLGSANGSLSFTNGSIYNGAITRSGAGPMSLTVNNATMNNSGLGTLNLTSMSTSNAAKIGLVVDNARVANNTPIYNVTGTATIAANTLFTPVFTQFAKDPFTLRVVNATTLNLGGPLSAMLNSNAPYIYDVALVQPNANAINLVVDVKTASELGLDTRQAGAYTAVLDLLSKDDALGAAVTSIPGSGEFLRGWADLMPGSDAAVMRVLSSNATAAFGATANRLDLIANKPDAPGGAWVEEFGVYHTTDKTNRSLGVDGGGFGVAAGIDVLSNGTALIGAYAALESAEMEESSRTSAPLNVAQTSFGLYGGWVNGNLAINGAASYGFIDFTSDRQVTISSLTDRLRAEWKGQSYTAAARATYNVPLGWLDVKPFVAADIIGFKQDDYQETAATDSKLAIIAGDADATLTTASYGIALVGNLGSDDAFAIKPELSVGYRNILSWDSTPAAMRFAGNTAGTSFTLDPGLEPEDALVAGLGLNINSQFLNVKLGYDAEIGDNSMTHYGSVTLRMAFW